MDKNAIKKYAVWARRELISRVSQKAMQYGISDVDIVAASAPSVNGVVLSAEEMTQRKALIVQIEAKGYKQVMEEVAYTWFNRFIALRFMEVNGYLPSRVRVFTDENNAFKPQILAEAINLELDGLDMDKVYALKDANNDDALFKYLIITQCNALNPILPGMFQRISDYTELLFPDNLLREGSAVEQMITLIPEDDWKDAVQIIGWLYQFYNIEPKAEVFGKKSGKITKEEIPAATQLFTPDWIVRYMVENSLGRLWVEGHPNEGLKSGWKYYLEEAEQEPEVQAQLERIHKEYADITPETIKCIDPCSGSGHILVYMFDVLMQIYEAYGYTTREAVRSIVENNIYGLDIDDRAAQLAYFAVMMKARQYDRRFFTRKGEDGNPDVPQPHVYEIMESNGLDRTAIEHFVGGDKELKKAMDILVTEMHDAKEYGSILNITQVDFAALYRRFDEVLSDISIFNITIERDLLPFVKITEILASNYDIVATNPPYMGISSCSAKLNDFAKKNYPDSKTDLYSIFIEKCKTLAKKNGYQAMITMHSWMFLSSFEKLRAKMLFDDLVNMAHLGARAFEEIAGEVVQTTAFVRRKSHVRNYYGTYCRLVNGVNQSDKEHIFLSKTNLYFAKADMFSVIPGQAIAYWISNDLRNVFEKGTLLSRIASPRQGMATADNNRFVRKWYEVPVTNVSFDDGPNYQWFPYNNGGGYRKWYGFNTDIVNWANNGAEIKAYPKAYVRNEGDYFKEGITWNALGSSSISVRYFGKGFIFSNAGMAIFTDHDNLKAILAFINSAVASKILEVTSPTLNFNAGDIANLPLLFDRRSTEEIIILADACIGISKQDWDSFEISWDFKRHPLAEGRKVSDAYDVWKISCDKRISKLIGAEETINELFAEMYGIRAEVDISVKADSIAIRCADLVRDIKSFISYTVGCMFGRYSLDVPGLVYAGGEWDDAKYVSFKADKDSIIPICDDEYFTDDIVGRFIRFVEVVYGKETLQENLRFIADALGGSGQPKDVIRNYFMNDFYADHLKIYQKRPIYWLFDSGKKGGFKALVYMHRYQPDTIARMRTDYVHEQQARYRTAIADLEQRIASASTSERVKLSKRLKTLQEQAAEIQSYEEKIHHLADRYITIDLDDGVKKNYATFKDVLAPIK